MFFPVFLFISTHISLDLLSLGSVKAYIEWGENWTVIWWQVVSEMFLPKLVKI